MFEKILNKNGKIRNAFELIEDMLYIILGSYLVSLAINLFLLPNKLTTGGVSGIATVLYYISGLPMGLSVILLNIPLFMISFTKIGKKFTIKSLISTVLLSIFLEVFTYERINITSNLDLLISCLFGGMLTGIGLSFVFRAGGSTGGADLLANIIYRFSKKWNLSQILLAIEIIIIIGIIIAFRDLNIGLYSIIAQYISSKMIDVFFEGINQTRVATIITNKKSEVLDTILYKLDRGATVINSVGGHTNNANYTITCIISRNQISNLKRNVYSIDNNAIMYITVANEVIGRGFKTIT